MIDSQSLSFTRQSRHCSLLNWVELFRWVLHGWAAATGGEFSTRWMADVAGADRTNNCMGGEGTYFMDGPILVLCRSMHEDMNLTAENKKAMLAHVSTTWTS